MRAATFKSSINVKSVGNPLKRLAELDMKAGEKALFATVYGKANGIVKRSDPKDPDKYYYGLKGTFEAVSSKEGSQPIGGAALYAPDAIHNLIVEQLKRGAETVSFVFEAYVVAGGTAGFTWEYKFADQWEPEEDDILSDLRAALNVPKLSSPEAPATLTKSTSKKAAA